MVSAGDNIRFKPATGGGAGRLLKPSRSARNRAQVVVEFLALDQGPQASGPVEVETQR